MLRQWIADRSPRTRRAGITAGAGMLVLIIVLTTVGGPFAAGPSPSPGGSADVGQASPDPSAVNGDWTALQLPAYEPVVQLLSRDGSPTSMEVDGSLTLRSLNGTPAVELAGRLRADPSADLIVEPGATADVAQIRPAHPLAENARYTFSLTGEDGALLAEWSFRTGGALHVVMTLPENHATQVPLDSGIEIVFDQDGVEDLASHVSILPSTPGRFEQHGRTWAFLPDAPLTPATLYEVTVSAGIGLEDSDRTLESDMRFAFETASPESRRNEPVITFERPFAEASPGDLPAIPVQVHRDTELPPTITATVAIHRVATLERATDIARQLSLDRSWATRSSTGSVDTTSLDLVASVDATVTTDWATSHVELPAPLDAGWYLLQVDQAGRDAQLLLQVTDLAAYVLTSRTDTVAWVNDVDQGVAVGGASVSVAGGPALGTTDASGLLRVRTPDAMGLRQDASAAASPLLLVSARDGRRVIAPLGAEQPWFQGETPGDRWWLLLETDRLQYRQEDTIHVWGVVRARSDRRVPDDVQLHLTPGYGTDGPPIVSVPVEATARGVIAADVPVRALPPGPYQVSLTVAGERLTSAGVSITDIRKPTVRIDLTTDRHVYIAGEEITAAITAGFFDGTPAPGLQLLVSSSATTSEGEQTVTLDSAGSGRVAHIGKASESPDVGTIHAHPRNPEEGSTTGSANFQVLPSAVWLEADAIVKAGTVRIDGRLTLVDLAAAEAQFLDDRGVHDPSGDPIAGGTVSVAVDRVTWNAVQTGTTYDFIEKRVVPTYRYDRAVRHIGAYTPVTGRDGTFTLSVSDAGVDDAWYEVTLSARDAEGRVTREVRSASSSEVSPAHVVSTFPYLDVACNSAIRPVGLGDTVPFTIREADGSLGSEAPTLFVVGRLGIDDTIVTTAPTIERVLDDDDLPGQSIRAIRLLPGGYAVLNESSVRVDPEDLAIEIGITADRPRYVPGEEATIAITTTGPDGRPISADVVVSAVDLKLFSIGAARKMDTSMLLQGVASGFERSYATHRIMQSRGDCGFGATTGGGDEPRSEFEDLATFQRISTDERGRGFATFELPDDLTSWVVSAAAVAGGLESGTASIEIPASLPFFVDATIASSYLSGEAPIIGLRAYGESLAAGDAVRFTVEAPSLGLDATPFNGRAFEALRVPLPELPVGDHRLTIAATIPGSEPALRDSIVRTVHVVPTRLRTVQVAYDPLTPDFAAHGGDGLTSHVVTDGGRGTLMRLLQQLSWGGSARFDTSLAADIAQDLLVDAFAADEAALPDAGFTGLPEVSEAGIRLLPYGSPDMALTARTALIAPDRVPTQPVRGALRTWADEAGANRERRIMALAGLAGLGDDVLAELRRIEGDLTVREQLWLGLGLQAAGDEAAARAIEREVLAAHGRRLGPWVRLDDALDTPEGLDASGALLLLAARLRDPVSVDLARYLTDHPSDEGTIALQQVGFARAALRWLPRDPARFAWTVDGERHEETLEPGGAFTLTLTAAQRESLRLERLDGDLVVVSTWAGEADYDALPAHRLVEIERTVAPASNAPADGLVRVTLNVRFGTGAPRGCYQVTDLLPSGLAPIQTASSAYGYYAEDAAIGPYEVEGQRVSWCIGPSDPTWQLGYTARVVTAGTYTWEPAVVQNSEAPEVGAATPVRSYAIR